MFVANWHNKDIIKTIRTDEKEKTLSDSEEDGQTFKCLYDEAIMDSVKPLKAFIHKEPSFKNDLKSLLQIEKLSIAPSLVIN